MIALKHILVATDFEEAADAALAYACSTATSVSGLTNSCSG